MASRLVPEPGAVVEDDTARAPNKAFFPRKTSTIPFNKTAQRCSIVLHSPTDQPLGPKNIGGRFSPIRGILTCAAVAMRRDPGLTPFRRGVRGGLASFVTAFAHAICTFNSRILEQESEDEPESI